MSNLANTILSAFNDSLGKKGKIAQAASDKQNRLSGYGRAAARGAGIEEDTPELIDFAGIAANADANIQKHLGEDAYYQDNQAKRSVLEAMDDSMISAAGAVTQSLGGMLTTGLAMDDEIYNRSIGLETGTTENKTGPVSEYLAGMDANSKARQSAGLRADRRAAAARNQATQQRNLELQAEDIANGDNEFMAGLTRVGRDFVDGFNNTSVMGVQDVIAQGAGSLAAGGLLGKGFTVAGAGKAAMPIAMGALEGGGAFNQTFNEMIDQGYSPSAARQAALMAAAIQGTVGATFGKISGGFEAAPLAVGSFAKGAGRILGEGVEETIQGTTSQLASNTGIKTYGDGTQDLAEGVGESAAMGLIGGMGIAGVVQGPGTLANGAVEGVKATAKSAKFVASPFVSALDARRERLDNENGAAAPTTDINVKAAVDAAIADSPEFETGIRQAIDENADSEVSKGEAYQYLDELMAAVKFDDAEADTISSSDVVRNAVRGSTDRFDAISRLTGLITSDNDNQLSAATALFEMLSAHSDLTDNKLQAAMDQVPEDHPMFPKLIQFRDAVAAIQNSEKVKTSLRYAIDIAKMARENGQINPISAAEINTETGQQTLRNTIMVSELSPLDANLEANETILRHADEGLIELPVAKRISLRTTNTLLRAQADRLARLEKMGLKQNRDIVSEEILVSSDNGSKVNEYSAAEHTRRIVADMKAGRTDEAKFGLTRFIQFAQHMQNKVETLNKALATGANSDKKALRYQAFRDGKEMESNNRLFVSPNSASSVELAQNIYSDAQTVAQVANELASIFPELGIAPVKVVGLDSSLVGSAADVVQAFRESRKAQSNAVPEAETEVQSTTEPTETGQPKGGDTPTNVESDKVQLPKRNKYTEKDQAKSDLANKFIGRGSPSSSTAAYAEAWGDQANTGEYSGTDIVFVSSEGGRPSRVEPDFAEIQKAVDAGVTFVTDNAANRDRGYNVGERQVASFLEESGYIENNGLWIPNTEAQSIETTKAEEAPVEIEAPVKPEAKPEPEIEQKADPVEVAKVVEPIEVEASAPKLEGMDAVFPDLIGSSQIKTVFKLPSEPKTRTIGTGSPLTSIRDALASSDALIDFLGSDLKNKLTDEIVTSYRKLLRDGTRLVEAMNANLAAELAKERGGLPISDYLLDDTLVVTTDKGVEYSAKMLLSKPNFRALHLVENQDGKLVYNQELLEAAVLASLQWVISADNFRSTRDAEDAAAILGIDEELVNDISVTQQIDGEAKNLNLVTWLNRGLTLVEAKRSMADKIQSYWGFSEQASAGQGIVSGIAESVAAELMLSLLSIDGMVQEVADNDSKKGSNNLRGMEPGVSKTVYLFIPHKFDETDPINGFPDAIEKAVMYTPKDVNHIGEAPTEIEQTQLRNPEVKNTDLQKAALEFEQKQPHLPNIPMINFLKKIGIDNVLKMFAAGDLNESKMNAEDLKSKDGLNRTFAAAYAKLLEVSSELQNKAEAAGVNQSEMPIFYRYAFTSVNRMQMLGLNNPQSSKLMREAILPTGATLDLSEKGQSFLNFGLGLAQALGSEVNAMTQVEAVYEAMNALGGRLSGSVALMQEWLLDQSKPFPDAAVDTLKSELGRDMSPVAVHAIMEYARYLNADQDARKEFKTALYVEADGVTNGVGNTMQLITPGRVTLEWLENMRKVGLFPGEAGMSMNAHRVRDKDDLYTGTTNKLGINRADLLAAVKSNPGVDKQLPALDKLMEMLLPAVTYKNGELIFGRDTAKNPLTITVYGSAAGGIASKITQQLAQKFYERLTSAMQAQSENSKLSFAEAMFPDADNPSLELTQFYAGLNELTTKVVKKNKGELFITQGEKTFNREMDPKDFVFSKAELKNLQQNLLTLFVQPLVDSIRETVGTPILGDPGSKAQSLNDGSAGTLRKAVQIQSIALEFAYQAEIDRRLVKKAKDPNWAPDDFLSKDELREAFDTLKPLAPIIETEAQRLYVSKTKSVDVGNVRFGQSLSGKLDTPAYIRGPANAGVKGIPSTIISFGDGLMMLSLSTMDNAPERTLKVFDGMHMPLDQLVETSQKANQAVYESWMTNPLQWVSDSYSTFLEAFSLKDASEAQLAAITRALNLRGDTASVEQIEQGIARLGVDLKRMALEVEARHRALARVNISVDQMASVGAPYQHTGDVSLEGLTDEQIIFKLNELAREELVKLKAETAVPEVVTTVSGNTASELETVGRKHKSGARVISYTALKNLVRVVKIPADQRALLGDVLRTLSTKEYKVVYGTAEELESYAAEHNIDIFGERGSQGVNGTTIPHLKTVFLIAPSSEVMLHELIHAATFDKLQTHYEGGDLGTNAAEQVDAIKRIEALMDQFLGLDTADMSEDAQTAYLRAVEEIEYLLRKDEKAAALNEFMAYALSNAELQKLTQKTKASPLVQLARDVVAALKKLIWGRRKMPPLADDMFSQLRFDTNILLRTKQDVRTKFAKTILFQGGSYGRNDRLTGINEVMYQKVIRHYRNTLRPTDARLSEEQKDEATKVFIKSKVEDIFSSNKFLMGRVSRSFKMSYQESSTMYTMASLLSTEIELDANALARVQDLYAYVTKNLKVEDFMVDAVANDPNDHAQAKRKYDIIVRDNTSVRDSQGRSTLLPVFLSLAIVNDEFRLILSKMVVPKTERIEGKTLDDRLRNVGNWLLDSLKAKVSGEGKARNVQEAIDVMMDQISEIAQDRETFMAKAAAPFGSGIDYLNDKMVAGMKKGAQYAFQKAEAIKASSTSKFAQNVATAVTALTGVLDEKIAGQVAEGAVSAMNRSGATQAVRSLVNDLVGRTESNAPVYDMIKLTDNWVTKRRQMSREELPGTIAKQYSRKLSKQEWTDLTNAWGKTDITALRKSLSEDELVEILQDPAAMKNIVDKLEAQLKDLEPTHWSLIVRKSMQLANYMTTGEQDSNLLRNATAVSKLLNEGVTKRAPATDALIDVVDQLVTLYAYDMAPQIAKDTTASLAQSEDVGVRFTLAYLMGQRKDEIDKTKLGNAENNYYKGSLPDEGQGGGSMIVIEESVENLKRYKAMSYVRVADYGGSNLDRRNGKMAYYYTPYGGRPSYSQGIMQTVRSTSYGIDTASGFTNGMTAGRITDPVTVRKITMQQRNEKATEPLLPVFDKGGEVVAYERSIDPAQMADMKQETDLSKIIGIWHGRQIEEAESVQVNTTLIERLHEVYETDIAADPKKEKEYIDVFDPAELLKDPVLADTMKLMTPETRAQVEQVFGTKFMVRKDLMDDALGYRAASVTDLWSGNSRWNEGAVKTLHNLVFAIGGNNAYRRLGLTEKWVQNFVSDARVMIVVKSVVVPLANMTANVFQLWARGVPLADIVSKLPKKTAEVNYYATSLLRLQEAEAFLRAAEASNKTLEIRKLKAEMQSIEDAHRRLSIYPLIAAGEFSSISDGTLTHDDIKLTDGRMSEYFEQLVDRLPDAVKTAGRYAIVGRDTALFQGLQRAVEYGDFLGKAVLYDELTQRKAMTKEQALAVITDEFVNYNRLPGRFRGAAEGLGLFWFYSFKLRSAKVALSMVRNNPVHAFMALMAPGSGHLPISDNIFSIAAGGNLAWSMGPGMGISSPLLNPWLQMADGVI